MAGDFPSWLRVTHFLTVIFIVLLIRSGLEVFSAHPKLYLDDDAKEGSEWFRWTKKRMPKDKLWTSTDEEEAFSPLIALPGRGLLGLGRHWHFFSVICWVGTGVVYVVLLFATGEWTRLVPTSWSIFSAALSTAGVYLSGHFPPPGDPYNPLQQLTYFGVVFILVTRGLPDLLYDFQRGVLRWQARLLAYHASLGEEAPPLALETGAATHAV